LAVTNHRILVIKTDTAPML